MRKSDPCESSPKRARSGISLNELAEANIKEMRKSEIDHTNVPLGGVVGKNGRVRRPHINYTLAEKSKFIRQALGIDRPLFALNRVLGLSEINQGLVEINSGDMAPEGTGVGIPVIVHLPQAGKVIETVLVPKFRFGAGLRQSKHLKTALSGKKRMVLVEVACDGDKPQFMMTFY